MKTNLVKKMTSLFLAVMMLISVVPMMASATEVSEGKFWQTISVVNMDGFTQNNTTNTAHDTNDEFEMWQGTKTATGTSGERTVHLETTTQNNYSSLMSKPNWKIHYGNTGLGSELSAEQLINKPAAVGDGHFNLSRHYDGGFPSPDASINLVNIFDEADVAVNDKVRITAYVWPEETFQIVGNKGDPISAPTITETTFSLWVSEGSTGQGLADKEYQYSVDTVANAKEGEYITTTIKNDQWNEVVLEYTITDENKLISSIQMNNDNSEHSVVYYPLALKLGAVKVEKLADANGSYTIEDGKKLETVNEFDFDGFTEETRDEWNWTHVYSETINNVKHTLNIYSDNGIMHGWSGLEDASTASSHGVNEAFSNLPSVVKTPASAKLGHVRRAWYNNTKGWTSPYSGFSMPEIYGTYTPQEGDTVRVSAYVFPTDAYTWKFSENSSSVGEGVEAPGEDEVEFTMWLSETEYTAKKIKVGQWNKVSLEYEINSTNSGLRGIKMFNAPMDGSTEWLFPTQMLIAGVTVEKYVDDETETAGRITGTVAVTPTAAEDGADYNVLVGAYKNVNGVPMMLGCSVMPFEADNTYDFVINDAEGATEVKAYLWNMNNIEPQILPIDCEYIAQ